MQANLQFCWRRGAGSNRRIKVLQTSALPLGYRANLWPSSKGTTDASCQMPQGDPLQVKFSN